MPWKESSVIDERMRFVISLKDCESMTSLCAELRISSPSPEPRCPGRTRTRSRSWLRIEGCPLLPPYRQFTLAHWMRCGSRLLPGGRLGVGSAIGKVSQFIRSQPGLWIDGHNVFFYHHTQTVRPNLVHKMRGNASAQNGVVRNDVDGYRPALPRPPARSWRHDTVRLRC